MDGTAKYSTLCEVDTCLNLIGLLGMVSSYPPSELWTL